MSSRDNAIEAALVEAESIRNRVYVFADGEGDGGYFAVNEQECDPQDLPGSLGFAEYDEKRKKSVWTEM